jgi:hypothetical protein
LTSKYHTPAARPGLGDSWLLRCHLILALAGGGPGPDAVFIPLGLGLGLLGRQRRLAVGSSAIVTIDKGCEIQGGMGTMEAEVLEGVGG